MKLAFAAFALLLAAQSATAHTYFKAELVPFGDQAPDAPDSSAYLDFYTHMDEFYWTLNVTDAVNMAAAQLVFGNPDIAAEPIVSFAAQSTPFNGSIFLEGANNYTEFAPEYPWSMKGLAANAGLGNVWAVIVNPADYHNIILAAPLEHYVPAGEGR